MRSEKLLLLILGAVFGSLALGASLPRCDQQQPGRYVPDPATPPTPSAPSDDQDS